MLREFSALPTNEDAKKMCDSDYLYCYAHMLLDDEEISGESIETGFNTHFDFKNYIKTGDTD